MSARLSRPPLGTVWLLCLLLPTGGCTFAVLAGAGVVSAPVLAAKEVVDLAPLDPEASVVGSGFKTGQPDLYGFWFVEEGTVLTGVEIYGRGHGATRGSPYRSRFVKIVPLDARAPEDMLAWQAGVMEADHLGDDVADLPPWRDRDTNLDLASDVAARERARAVWVVGTRPSVVAIAAGEPRQDWQVYQERHWVSMRSGNASFAPWDVLVRYVFDDQLGELVTALEVNPAAGNGHPPATTAPPPADAAFRVTLPQPTRLELILKAIEDGAKLAELGEVGPVTQRPTYRRFDPDLEGGYDAWKVKHREETRAAERFVEDVLSEP